MLIDRDVLRRSSIALAAASIALSIALVACEDEQRLSRFRVTFTSLSDGEPLGGVSVIADGQPVGTTGPDGLLRIEVEGHEGRTLSVHAQCPSGYRAPEPLPVLTLRSFQGLDPVAAERGLEMTISCPPSERTAAIVVRTGQPDLPIRMRGQELARTDAAGVAHFALTLRPNTTFRLAIDTSLRTDLRPQNPSVSFTIPDADEVFLYDQPFETKRRPRRVRVRPAEPPPPALPTRIN